MLAKDSSCRPSEIRNLLIKDLNFKRSPDGTKQYAEIMVNGKTGTRSIPLFNSLPYVKDWLDDHHEQDPKAHLIPSLDTRHRKFGHRLNALSLNSIYRKYRSQVFPTFLEDPKVSPEDKQKIGDLLKKPWNPYIRRHSALTQKAQVLREPLSKLMLDGVHLLLCISNMNTGMEMNLLKPCLKLQEFYRGKIIIHLKIHSNQSNALTAMNLILQTRSFVASVEWSSIMILTTKQ